MLRSDEDRPDFLLGTHHVILVIDGVLEKLQDVRKTLFAELDKFVALRYEHCPDLPHTRTWVFPEILDALKKTHGGKPPDVKASYLRGDDENYVPSQVCHTHQRISQWSAVVWLNR